MTLTTLRIPVAALVPEPVALSGTKKTEDAIAVVTELLMQAEGPMLAQYKEVFTQQLLALPVGYHKALKSKLIRLIAHLDERREEAELAANPERRAGIERIGEHFAYKAQSGFSPINRQPLIIKTEPLNVQVIKLKNKRSKQ